MKKPRFGTEPRWQFLLCRLTPSGPGFRRGTFLLYWSRDPTPKLLLTLGIVFYAVATLLSFASRRPSLKLIDQREIFTNISSMRKIITTPPHQGLVWGTTFITLDYTKGKLL